MSHSKYIRVLDDFYDKNFPEFITLRTKVRIYCDSVVYNRHSDIMVTCCSTVRGNFQLNCFVLS